MTPKKNKIKYRFIGPQTPGGVQNTHMNFSAGLEFKVLA